MRELLKAQAYVARANVGDVIVNTQPRAGDDGADGMSPAPPAPDAWLGAVATCWQFKSGRAGEPAELVGEVIKPIPKHTLEIAAHHRVSVTRNDSLLERIGHELATALASWLRSRDPAALRTSVLRVLMQLDRHMERQIRRVRSFRGDRRARRFRVGRRKG